ncbi:MAG: RNA 2',3'-cyclic phosphodiesterase [Thermomicrobiales bacterium]
MMIDAPGDAKEGDDERNEADRPAGPRMVRLFIALETNEAMQHAVASVQRSLRQRGDLPVRWVAPQQVHLTLQFLGSVVAAHIPSLVRAVEPAVAKHAAMLLRAGEVGAFPSADAPRVLWLGVRGDDDGLLALQRAVRDAVRGVEGVVADRKPFRPHLTLGRVRAGRRDLPGMTAIAAALARPVAAPPTAWPVREVSLIRSVLGPGGSRYTIVERFPLVGGE